MLTKICVVKAMVFPVVMYGCENWTIKKAEHKRIDAFELWCWRRLLRVTGTARRSNQSILKEINLEYPLEGVMLKLKLQYFGHLMWRADIGKDPDAGKDWRQEKEKGTTEDEMAGWHRWLDGCESGWTPGIGDGQGGLVCWDSWGHKESDTTERLNWTELNASCHWFYSPRPCPYQELYTLQNHHVLSHSHLCLTFQFILSTSPTPTLFFSLKLSVVALQCRDSFCCTTK